MQEFDQDFAAARVLFRVTTNTDWMTLTLPGEETIVGLDVVILAGEDAPNLRSNVEPKLLDIGKKQYDETLIRVEITVGLLGLESDTELPLELFKGCIGFSHIEIYNYNLDTPRLISTRNITQCDSPYTYSLVDNDILAPSPFINFESIQRTPKHIFAFYYPWYGNPEGGGEWIHWKDSNHDPTLIHNGTRDLASTHYPALGAYDSNNPEIVRHHIRIAQAAGIDAFIASWWGIGTFEDRAFRVLLNQAAIADFPVTIYFESAPYWNLDEPTAYNGILRDLRYIYDNYATHPAFYKAKWGLQSDPLVFIYVAGAWNVEFWQKLIGQLRNEGRIMRFHGDTRDSIYLKAFDGIHDYFPLFSPDLGEYYTTGAIATRLLEYHTGQAKMFAATVAPGFNATAISPGSDTIPHEEGTTFDMAWKLAIATGTDAILITSFNEWHEGTEVENSREFGGRYLEAILRWRQRIQPTFEPTGNLTTLNQIITAISLQDWASLVYPDREMLDQVDAAIAASKSDYDAANYDAAFLQAQRAIDIILTMGSSTTTTPAPVSTPPTTAPPLEESVSPEWITFGVPLGTLGVLVIVSKRRKSP